MKVTGTISLDIDREQQRTLVTQIMAEDYYHLSLAVQELKAKEITEGIEQFERDDLENHLTDMKHLDGAMAQYMDSFAYDNWCKAWKKFRSMYI